VELEETAFARQGLGKHDTLTTMEKLLDMMCGPQNVVKGKYTVISSQDCLCEM
jgi:hypothetical protein